MPAKLKVGIVGCGAIGGSLAKIITKDLKHNFSLVALYDIDKTKSKVLSRRVSKNRNLTVDSLKTLIGRSELVIESASGKSSWDIARNTITKGRDIMIMSVGGVVAHYKDLSRLAKKFKARVYIPSGAISGIDALKAAKIVGLKKVTLTTRKNPISFKGVKYIEKKKIDLTRIRKDRELFCGPASQAVKYFPQNINVASVLAMSGIGENKTEVRIIASPGLKRNIHEICMESVAGRVTTRTENILHPKNPKTSYLAVLSAAATLRQILEPVRIGT